MTASTESQSGYTQNRGIRVTLMLSGSVAAYKACALVSMLVKDGHEVQTLATEGALKFVGEAGLEALSGRPVYTDLWARRESMSHIELRRWSDLYIVYPATANRINQMAAGFAEDLFGATFLANNFQRPVWIAPAMNTGMLEHPATQASLARLASWGCRLVYGGAGSLACGDIGAGRLAEPEQLAGMVRAASSEIVRKGREWPARALVTGGAMDVPLDAVRSIRNTSTGRTASAIVAELLQRGWEVDYLHHAEAVRERTEGAGLLSYRTFPDFEARIGELLAAHEYQAVVQAAAVSDYRIEQLPQSGTKWPSSSAFDIRLEPNPKILSRLRTMTMGQPLIVGFKLTVGDRESQGASAAAPALEKGQADLMVWNDLSGIDGDRHPFAIFGAAPVIRGETLPELATALANELEKHLAANAQGPAAIAADGVAGTKAVHSAGNQGGVR